MIWWKSADCLDLVLAHGQSWQLEALTLIRKHADQLREGILHIPQRIHCKYYFRYFVAEFQGSLDQSALY